MHISSFGINNSLILILMVIHDNFPTWNLGERRKDIVQFSIVG